MSQTSAQGRESAVQAITRRTMLEERIKRTQRRMAALEGEARQVLEYSLAADQAALAEVPPALEAAKTVMRQEEGHIRRKTQEALRAKGEWRASYLLNHSLGGSSHWGPGQTFALAMILAAMVTMVTVLLLNR